MVGQSWIITPSLRLLQLHPSEPSLEVGVLSDTSVDLFGKTVTDLMDNVEIADNAATGTLKYVADYSAAFPAGEDSGNYIALKATSDAGATITGQVVGGLHDAVTLDEDGILVAYVTATTQDVKFIATKNGQTKEVVIDLAGITLATE